MRGIASSGCLAALKPARTNFAVFLPNAFRIKSSLDKDNDSCMLMAGGQQKTPECKTFSKEMVCVAKTEVTVFASLLLEEVMEKRIMNKVLIDCAVL